MHVMLDLETLSTRPNAAILSVGAVAFDSSGIHSKFCMAIHPEQLIGHIDGGTVAWWMKQSEEARQEATKGIDGPDYLCSAFAKWFQIVGGEELWGNGADFDNVIFKSMYDAVGLKAPWEFYNNRCYRTLKNCTSVLNEVPLERVGVHHNAVNDAESQARHLIAIDKFLGGMVL